MTQAEVYARSREVDGYALHYKWQWTLGGQLVTRQVNRLLDKKLVRATYYGKNASLTPFGKEV